MNSEELVLQSSDITEPKKLSIIYQIIYLFISPSRTFSSLKSRPKWFVPFLLCLVFGFLMLAARDNPTWEMYRRIPEFITFKQVLLASTVVTLKHSIELFGISFLIWLGLQFYPQKTTYPQILSVVSFSFLVLLPETIVRLPLIFMKGSTKVYLGLAILLPAAWENSPLFRLCRELNVFSIWMVGLLMIGIPIVTGISRKRAAITVAYLWAIWLLCYMFLGSYIQIL